VSGSGWVDRKPDLRKNEVRLNLTPEPKPIGFRVGFGCPSDFVNVFLSGVFQVSIGFFLWFWILFGFLFRVFWLSGFFRVPFGFF
jgi:hypothetical protein